MGDSLLQAPSNPVEMKVFHGGGDLLPEPATQAPLMEFHGGGEPVPIGDDIKGLTYKGKTLTEHVTEKPEVVTWQGTGSVITPEILDGTTPTNGLMVLQFVDDGVAGDGGYTNLSSVPPATDRLSHIMLGDKEIPVIKFRPDAKDTYLDGLYFYGEDDAELGSLLNQPYSILFFTNEKKPTKPLSTLKIVDPPGVEPIKDTDANAATKVATDPKAITATTTAKATTKDASEVPLIEIEPGILIRNPLDAKIKEIFTKPFDTKKLTKGEWIILYDELLKGDPAGILELIKEKPEEAYEFWKGLVYRENIGDIGDIFERGGQLGNKYRALLLSRVLEKRGELVKKIREDLGFVEEADADSNADADSSKGGNEYTGKVVTIEELIPGCKATPVKPQPKQAQAQPQVQPQAQPQAQAPPQPQQVQPPPLISPAGRPIRSSAETTKTIKLSLSKLATSLTARLKTFRDYNRLLIRSKQDPKLLIPLKNAEVKYKSSKSESVNTLKDLSQFKSYPSFNMQFTLLITKIKEIDADEKALIEAKEINEPAIQKYGKKVNTIIGNIAGILPTIKVGGSRKARKIHALRKTRRVSFKLSEGLESE
jgi:hypothetical protein